MPKATAQPSLFDDALNPAPAAPLAEAHEPRPAAGGYSAKCIIDTPGVARQLGPVRYLPGLAADLLTRKTCRSP